MIDQSGIVDELSKLSEEMRRYPLSEVQCLEEFVTENAELDRLEEVAGHFNIFEAIGMVHQEIRHSTFLAFLLDPGENHGLDDWFLRRFLKVVLIHNRSRQADINLIDIDVWDFEDVKVSREWANIDILLTSEGNELAVIIENKVYSGEHSDQLNRYHTTVSRKYPGWRILPIFISPDESGPSDPRYMPVGYVRVADLVLTTLASRQGDLGADMHVLLSHYEKMLRRHLVSGSEVDILCERIYRRHKRAIDLIIERLPDLQQQLKDEIVDMISGTPDYVVTKAAKWNIQFLPAVWNRPELLTSSGLPVIEFSFHNAPNGVTLGLYIINGSVSERQSFLDVASANQPPFSVTRRSKTLGTSSNRVFHKLFLGEAALRECSTSDLLAQLRRSWYEFISKDFLEIEHVLDTSTSSPAVS